MNNEVLGSIIWDLLILAIGIYLVMKSFGIIETIDEKRRTIYTSKKVMILSCVLCLYMVVSIVLRLMGIKFN